MGTVYLCEHAVLRRKLAVKVLRSDLTTDPELVDRFRNEAIAASRIGQENVVDVLDFGTAEDGALYYVMEALEGRSLGAVIREEGALQVGRALDLLEQICRALAAAHARGVVHRDVKPDNVLLVLRDDGSELAKVIDFGISQVPRPLGVAPITRTGAIIGTPEYMAPEQATGAPVDRRTDVYAAGVLAFEMLTGQLPIEAETPIATLVAHQTHPPDPPSRRRASIPPEVDALVLRALAKKPEDRFESMEELAAEVARLRAAFGRPTVAYAPRPSLPRGGTVALPESADEVRRATLRVKGAAPVVLALVAAAAIVAAGWYLVARMRGGDAARTAEVLSTPTPTANPTPSPTATPPPAPLPPVHAPIPVDETPAAAAPPVVPVPMGPARTRKVSRRPAPVPAEETAPDDGLKDPYSGSGDLKDPFK